MAIARISDCEAWHSRYCELYWQLNEWDLIGVARDEPEVKEVVDEMAYLVVRLGYVPAP